MLTIINLYVLDKIFNEDAETKLSHVAKVLYMNCLTHHFREKAPSVVNAIAFEIFKNDIKDYIKFQPVFEELHKSGLIVIGIDAISFQNVWGRHIDRSRLDKVTPQEYVAGFHFTSPEEFKNELLKNQSLYELSAMKYKLNIRQFEALIELFVKEQVTFEKKYPNLADCTKHFSYWIPHNINKAPVENIKSKGKLLGE